MAMLFSKKINTMKLLKYFPLLNSVALAGSFLITQNQGECLLWSENNHGLTGHSGPFAQLEGKHCSSKKVFTEK